MWLTESAPHVTAILNTLQQIAGAFGTSLFIAIMTASQKNYLMSIGNTTDSTTQALSLAFGVHRVFIIQVFVLTFAIVLSLFLKRKTYWDEKYPITNSATMEE